MSGVFEAFFMDASIGQRFCLFYPPCGGRAALGAIIYVHPFAEELNRTRRMAAMQARAFAAAGYAVLQIDLLGCGDSSDDFGEATWDAWIEDVGNACAWLRKRIDAPLWIWGLRAGCLIAAQAASANEDVKGLVFWQPVFSGRQCLQQFLRLKLAGDMLSGDRGGSTERLQQQLARGEPVEIAGYLLSPALADGLGRAEMSLPAHVRRIACLEMSARTEPSLSPALAARVEEWRSAGRNAHVAAVPGPAFWQTAEIAETRALIEATLSAIRECSS